MRPGAYSFSVKKRDRANMELVEELSVYSVQSGITFSHIVIEALKLYREENAEQINKEK